MLIGVAAKSSIRAALSAMKRSRFFRIAKRLGEAASFRRPEISTISVAQSCQHRMNKEAAFKKLSVKFSNADGVW